MIMYHFPFSISHFKEKSSTASRSESGFIPESAMRKTLGLSHTPKESK